MSYTTNFAITTPANPELVFLAVRRLTGVPGEHPFRVRTDHWGDTEIISEPGFFDAGIIVWHHDGLPVCLDDDSPVTYVRVSFDTSYGYQGPNGTDATDLHRRITAELGQWCDDQGLPWATNDERDCGRHQSWRERTPAFT
jgi:hypothetical protein